MKKTQHMKSYYKLNFIVFCCIAILYSCSPKEEFTVFVAEAETEFGEKIINGTDLVGTVHSDSSEIVTEGVRESYMNFLAMNGYLTKIYVYEIDLSNPGIDLAVSTANDYNSASYSKQNLTEQAVLIDSESNKILGGINGDFFNATGRPNGILFKNGNKIKAPASKPTASYFAITKDKKPLIGDELELKTEGTDHLRDAVGGKDWLVKGGELMPQVVPTKEAKSAVGITPDGKVILFVVDGGLYFYSNGMLLADVAKVMKSLGATDAITLSGGKNSTFISRRGDDIVLRNMPSNNGQEEAVTNGIVIVQK